jgi:hypothetical protein
MGLREIVGNPPSVDAAVREHIANLIERFLSNGALTQPVDAPPVVRHAFYLLLPSRATPSASSLVFSNWVKSSFPKKEASLAGAIELDDGWSRSGVGAVGLT